MVHYVVQKSLKAKSASRLLHLEQAMVVSTQHEPLKNRKYGSADIC